MGDAMIMELTEPTTDDLADAEERAALERCQRGDVQAFGIVVRKYMKPAYSTAFRWVGQHDDALDLSQEAFVRAFRAIARFDARQRFFTWYYRILRNVCLNFLRYRDKRRPAASDGTHLSHGSIQAIAAEIADARPDPSVLAERNDLSDQLWNAMGALKSEDREILLLREMDGCSYAEISARLEIPPGTVMSRLFYARKHLKESLEQYV